MSLHVPEQSVGPVWIGAKLEQEPDLCRVRLPNDIVPQKHVPDDKVAVVAVPVEGFVYGQVLVEQALVAQVRQDHPEAAWVNSARENVSVQPVAGFDTVQQEATRERVTVKVRVRKHGTEIRVREPLHQPRERRLLSPMTLKRHGDARAATENVLGNWLVDVQAVLVDQPLETAKRALGARDVGQRPAVRVLKRQVGALGRQPPGTLYVVVGARDEQRRPAPLVQPVNVVAQTIH